MLRGSTDFLKTGTPYCTDQFCMDQRFKNILQKQNSVGSADIALTALLDHIITEPVCGQENLCTHCVRSSTSLYNCLKGLKANVKRCENFYDG